jgi:hypothetical protein
MPRWPAGYKKKHPERDYKKEAKAASAPERVKDRVARNKARREMEKAGKVHKGDGKEVDHKVPIGGKANKNNYGKGNLQVISRAENRRKQPKRK